MGAGPTIIQFKVRGLESRDLKNRTEPSSDIHNTDNSYRRCLRELPKWETKPSNKKLIFEFLRKTEVEGIGVAQRVKYFYSFKTLLRAVNKDLKKFEIKDLEDYILYMQHYSMKARETRWYGLKKFFCYIGKEKLFESVKPSFKEKGSRFFQLPFQFPEH